MCYQIEEDDDLDDLQPDSLQRLQHGRPVQSPSGHQRQMIPLSLQRPSYEAEDEKVKTEKGGMYLYDAVKRMEMSRVEVKVKCNLHCHSNVYLYLDSFYTFQINQPQHQVYIYHCIEAGELVHYVVYYSCRIEFRPRELSPL